MCKECMKIFDKLEDIAWHCYYKTEIICGYCENNVSETLSSTMFFELISEIRDIQKDVIRKIDVFTTNQNHKMYKAKIFHPDCTII